MCGFDGGGVVGRMRLFAPCEMMECKCNQSRGRL